MGTADKDSQGKIKAVKTLHSVERIERMLL